MLWRVRHVSETAPGQLFRQLADSNNQETDRFRLIRWVSITPVLRFIYRSVRVITGD